MSSGPQTGHATGAVGVGAVLGDRYRLVARAGAGGMATIFRARDTALERDVAVKVLHPHLADDPVLLERFRTEARHAARLLHPHIVNVFDWGEGGRSRPPAGGDLMGEGEGEAADGQVPYIVMEFVSGPSLREVLLARGRLSPREALAVVGPVCQALVRAHAAGVVHRDVKPENVLITPEGQPKVADFGIARAIAATSHTQTGTLVGSVHYMAPELVDGREATPASDQYAAGVLLFELLTGRKPLPADSPMAVALRHAREDLPAPSRFADDVGRALDRVVAKATAADPRKRYADLGALAEALHAAVPAGASPVVVPEVTGPGGDHTLIIPADAQDTVSVDAAQELGKRRPRPRRRSGAMPWRRSRRRPRGVPLLAVLVLAALVVGGGAWGTWNYVVAPLTGVPSVVGLSEAEAAQRLADAGFTLEVTRSTSSVEQPAGAIVSQDPAAGDPLRRGGSVAVTQSSGPATVPMPDVLGQPVERATATLTGPPHFFEVTVDESFSDTVPRGQVAGQAPRPDEPVEQGREVIVNVSLGIEQVEVPDLSGASRQEAAALLREAKLEASFTQEYSDEVPDAGQVVRQSVAPGQKVDKGSTVEVTVSAGPQTFSLPDVEGTPVESAADTLRSRYGLDVNVIAQPRPRFGPFRRGRFGLVELQDPQPGETVARGDSVDLYTYTERAERERGDGGD